MEIKEIEKNIMQFVEKRTKAKNYELTKNLVFIHPTEELGEVAK